MIVLVIVFVDGWELMDYKKICFIAVLFGLVFHAGDDLLYQYKTYLGYGNIYEETRQGWDWREPDFGRWGMPMMDHTGIELSEGWQVDYNGTLSIYKRDYPSPGDEGKYDVTITRFKRLRYYQWQEWIQRRTKN